MHVCLYSRETRSWEGKKNGWYSSIDQKSTRYSSVVSTVIEFQRCTLSINYISKGGEGKIEGRNIEKKEKETERERERESRSNR